MQSRVSRAAVGAGGWIHTSLEPGALRGWSPPRGGASGRGLALAGWEEPGRGLWLRLAARCEKPTRQPRLLGARPSTCCPRPAPGGAAMRLALLWALGLLGAGSPLPSRPLPDIGECLARSGPGVALGGRAGKSEDPGVLGSAGDPERPHSEHSLPASDVLGRGPGDGAMEWGGKVEGCRRPWAGHPPKGPRGHFQASGPGLAQHPLRIAVVGLGSAPRD